MTLSITYEHNLQLHMVSVTDNIPPRLLKYMATSTCTAPIATQLLCTVQCPAKYSGYATVATCYALTFY